MIIYEDVSNINSSEWLGLSLLLLIFLIIHKQSNLSVFKFNYNIFYVLLNSYKQIVDEPTVSVIRICSLIHIQELKGITRILAFVIWEVLKFSESQTLSLFNLINWAIPSEGLWSVGAEWVMDFEFKLHVQVTSIKAQTELGPMFSTRLESVLSYMWSQYNQIGTSSKH